MPTISLINAKHTLIRNQYCFVCVLRANKLLYWKKKHYVMYDKSMMLYILPRMLSYNQMLLVPHVFSPVIPSVC